MKIILDLLYLFYIFSIFRLYYQTIKNIIINILNKNNILYIIYIIVNLNLVFLLNEWYNIYTCNQDILSIMINFISLIIINLISDKINCTILRNMC